MTVRRNAAERRAATALDLARSDGRDAPIEIVDYDSSWPVRFRVEATRLAEIAAVIKLDHIGSTALPGLPAKPIIDVISASGWPTTARATRSPKRRTFDASKPPSDASERSPRSYT